MQFGIHSIDISSYFKMLGFHVRGFGHQVSKSIRAIKRNS